MMDRTAATPRVTRSTAQWVFDQNSGTPFLSNREEIGKGGIDVVLFVDNNNNGVYDAGDELIPAKGGQDRRHSGKIEAWQGQRHPDLATAGLLPV